MSRNRLRIAIPGACALLLSALAGCGGGGHTPLASGCVIADVSPSTTTERTARSDYANGFATFARGIGMDGSGKLCVVLAAGDPVAEGHPVLVDVGPRPADRDSRDQKGPEVRNKVTTATSEMMAAFANPDVATQGSALVEAAVVASDELRPGDRLLFLSDGVEHSPLAGNFRTQDLSPAGIQRLLAAYDRAGLRAHLTGVHIEFPYLLANPGGFHISIVQEAAIRLFWTTWAHHSGADITFAIQDAGSSS